jgi:hypothetical protein
VEIEGRPVQTAEAGAVRSALWFGPLGHVLQEQRLSSFREASPFVIGFNLQVFFVEERATDAS